MIDVNKPVTNPSLVNAMNKMRELNTKESQDDVINEVMNAHLIAPVSISPVPETPTGINETVLKEKTTIGFTMIENTENQNFFLAFTDWDELGKWNKTEGQQTLIVRFNDLATMVLNEDKGSDGFVINPFTQNLTFNKTMVSALHKEAERCKNGGVVEQVVEKETPVQLGQPKNYPKEMTDAISSYLKKQSSVKAAYLQLMIREGQQSYLIIVDFDGDRRKIFDGIGEAAMKYLNGMYIDLVPFNSGFGKRASTNVEPFYKKKKSWFFGK